MKCKKNAWHKASFRWGLVLWLGMGWAVTGWAAQKATTSNSKTKAATTGFKPIILRPLTNAPTAGELAGAGQTVALRALMYEGMADVQQGRTAQAIPKLEKVVAGAPQLVAAWETLGWSYWKMDRQSDAIALWNRLRDLDPNLPQVYNLLGAAAMSQNNLIKAREHYSKSLQLNPDQFETTFALGRIERWTGDMDLAIEHFRALLAKDPARSDVKIELARALSDNRQFEEAAPLWAEALKLSPTNQEYMAREAAILLHSGHVQESQQLAEEVLKQNPENVFVYLLLADAAERGENPADAIPPLRKIIEVTKDNKQRNETRTRLIRLFVRLNKKAPLSYSLDEPLALTRDILKDNPNNVDAHLMMGELLLGNQKFDDAEKKFLFVLKQLNLNNRRARSGLFEVYLAERRYSDAKKQYKLIEAFNPADPYLFLRQARLEEARGNYSGALEALEKLEQAGKRGVVSILLYHGLTTSEWLDIPSVTQFKNHILAMKKAGFRFITPDRIPEYFAGLERTADIQPGQVPDRVACITFDDARRDAMRLGTEVAKETDVVLAMHVPVAAVEEGDPFICTWDQLKQYQATGRWVYGSHLYEAHEISPVAADLQPGYPLANRLWLKKEARMETEEEYLARIRNEYSLSRKLLEEKLGRPVTFVAYPMGDFGQETLANQPNALQVNLAACATNYAIGFIQSVFGCAVNGDNPAIYQRHEMERGTSGEDVVNQLIENHPIYLALRMRAEMAALQGKVHLALDTVDQLKQAGYPEPLLKAVNTYIHSRLAGQFEAPTKTEKVVKGPLHFEPSKPYVGVQGSFFNDNLDSRIWRVYGLGGMNITPNLAAEGRAGFGQLRQTFTNSSAANVPEIQLDEKFIGVAPSFTFPNGWVLMGELAQRTITGDVPTNMNGRTASFNKSFIQYAVEGQAKPFLPLDVSVRWEHDLMPAARAVVKETTYNLGSISAVYSLFDWWDLWGSAQRYWISDGNNRDHLGLTSSWLVYEPVGLHLGLGYAYANAATNSPDYWVPYKLNRYFLEASLRGNYLRAFYNLRLRYGVGKQSVRPEDEAAYQEALSRAQREHWSQAAINDLIANQPSTDWQPVFGASASTDVKLGEHWSVNGEVSFNKVPDYDEITVTGGAKYRF